MVDVPPILPIPYYEPCFRNGSHTKKMGAYKDDTS